MIDSCLGSALTPEKWLKKKGCFVVSLTFASWNQIAAWLRQLDCLRAAG